MSKQWIQTYFAPDTNIRYSDMGYLKPILEKALEEQEKGTWKDIVIDVDTDSYGDQIIVLRGKRLETDAEYEQRTKYEAYQKQVRRQMYEDLKKEFGDK